MSTLVQRFSRDTDGRDLIVGDIHGCFTKLQAALDSVGFDPTCDRLFSVGDLVDRGPESDRALEWLAQPWFHAVQGNHEDMAIRFLNGNIGIGNYMANGGAWNIGNTPDVQRDFAEAFSALPIAIELQTKAGVVGIVHASCPFDSWSDFTEVLEHPDLTGALRRDVIDLATWSRDRISNQIKTPVLGARAVVCGHTPVEAPVWLGNTLYIDCKAWWGQPPLKPFVIVNAATLQQEGV